jgi:hypothetical protein
MAVNRRGFLKCSLMLPLGAGIFGIPAESLASSSKPIKYVGVWRGGLGRGYRFNPAADWSSFAAKNKEHVDQGLRLVAISSYYEFDERESKYSGVWRAGQGSDAQLVTPAIDWNTFAAKTEQYRDQGLRLVAISVSNARGNLRYVGVWRGGQGNAVQRVHPGMEWSDFKAQDKKYFDQGLRLGAVGTTYNVEGRTVYAGVWRGGLGTGAQGYWPATNWNDFSAQANEFEDQGLRVTAISMFFKSGEPVYFSVWRSGQGSAAQRISPAVDWSTFAARSKTYYDQGLRLVGIAVSRDQSVGL